MPEKPSAQAQSHFLTLLILTAIPWETRIFLELGTWKRIHKTLPLFAEQNNPYFLLEVGLGMSLPPEQFLSVFHQLAPRTVINIGLCGALEAYFSPGAFFRIRKIYSPHQEPIILPEPSIPSIQHLPTQTLLTVSEPVLARSHRQHLFRQYQCGLVDMEAYFIARNLHRENVEIVVLKIVSDQADEDALKSIRQNLPLLKTRISREMKNILF